MQLEGSRQRKAEGVSTAALALGTQQSFKLPWENPACKPWCHHTFFCWWSIMTLWGLTSLCMMPML